MYAYLNKWHMGLWCCQCVRQMSTFPCRCSWGPWGKSQLCKCTRCRRPWWNQTSRSFPAPERHSEGLKRSERKETCEVGEVTIVNSHPLASCSKLYSFYKSNLRFVDKSTGQRMWWSRGAVWHCRMHVQPWTALELTVECSCCTTRLCRGLIISILLTCQCHVLLFPADLQSKHFNAKTKPPKTQLAKFPLHGEISLTTPVHDFNTLYSVMLTQMRNCPGQPVVFCTCQDRQGSHAVNS